jgi:hypothetical protein
MLRLLSGVHNMQLKTVQFTAYTIIGVDEIQDDKNFQIDENGIA